MHVKGEGPAPPLSKNSAQPTRHVWPVDPPTHDEYSKGLSSTPEKSRFMLHVCGKQYGVTLKRS